MRARRTAAKGIGARGALVATASCWLWVSASAAVAQTEDPASPTPPTTVDAPPAPSEEPAPLPASPLVAEESPPPPSPPPEPMPPPPADDGAPQPSAGPFSRGAVRLSLLVGWGSTVADDYLILGGGLGYYILDGLEIGLDYEAWILADPVFHRLSPGVRYVFHMVPVIKPYVGTFYRHTFVSDFDDLDYLGVRGGIYVAPPRGVFVGVGAVYEHLLDCTSGAFVDCDDVYPEIFFGITL